MFKQTENNDDSGIEQPDNGEDSFKESPDVVKEETAVHKEETQALEEDLLDESEEESDCCEMTNREKRVSHGQLQRNNKESL